MELLTSPSRALPNRRTSTERGTPTPASGTVSVSHADATVTIEFA